jgi:hypothetical protein
MNAGRNAAEAEIRACADAADVLACEKLVETFAEKRAAAITAAKPAAAMEAESALMAARITREIAVAKATASTAKHAAAVDMVKTERIAKAQRAVAVIDSEMVAMAAEFSQALDAALEIGERLQALSSRDHLRTPLNVPFPSVPVEVVRALERMPKPNPYDVPISELRFGASSDAWARRFKELTADDEPIDADDHTLRVEVGTHSRVAESLVISNGDATR